MPEESPASATSANAMLERFPKMHARAHDPHSFSYSDGSAKKTGGGQQTDEGGRSESIGTLTGTGLIMAHTHQELRIDPNGKDTTNTINRAELVGVVSWLEEIMREELATASTFKLLTDSQVTLQYRRQSDNLLQHGSIHMSQS